MLKKFLSILLAALMLLLLSACQDGDTNSKKKSNEKNHTHQYADATCEAPMTCECGETVGLPLDHDYTPSTCTAPKVCNRCGATEGEAKGHHYVDATCVSPKHCEVCNTVAGDPLGHNFVDEKCTRCEKWDRTYLIEDINYLDKSDDVHLTMDPVTDNRSVEYFGHYVVYGYASNYNPSIEFQTDKTYHTFYGTAILPYQYRGNAGGYIRVYGDGKLLYRSKMMGKEYSTETFSVDITSVNIVKIEFDVVLSLNSGDCVPYLTNAYFTK